MEAKDYTQDAARVEAGARALKIVHDYGNVVGGQVIAGYLEAELRAHAALHGWSATFALVRECARGSWVPPIGEKARLVYSAPPPIASLSA